MLCTLQLSKKVVQFSDISVKRWGCFSDTKQGEFYGVRKGRLMWRSYLRTVDIIALMLALTFEANSTAFR